MRRARGIAAAVALGLFGQPAGAERDWRVLMDCSATYTARIEYLRVLDGSPAGHLHFLQAQADLFLTYARSLAPKERIGCGDSYGLTLGLTLCYAPATLYWEMKPLVLDKLTRLVEENGGIYPLPTCMEDEECAACMRVPYPEIQPKAP